MGRSLTVKLYSLHSLLSKLFFFLPIIVIFFLDQGLSQFQVTVVMSSFFLSATIAEIPSGIFSDRFGHKWALLLCGFLQALGMVIIARSTHMGEAVLGEVLNGVGYAFYTGSKESYLFDYLSVTEVDGTYQRHFARAKLFEFVGMAAGGLVGGTVYIFWHELPFYLSAGSFLASSLLAVFLPEERKETADQISSPKDLLKGFGQIRSGPVNLRLFVDYYCVFHTSVLLFLVTLNQPYLKGIGIPLASFGVIFLFFHLASMGGSELARALSSKKVTGGFFLILGLALSLALLALGFMKTPLALIVIIVMHFAWGLFFPTVSHATNQLIQSSTRATVLATQDFAQNLLFVGVAPLLGLATDVWGLPSALLILSVFSALTALLSLRMRG